MIYNKSLYPAVARRMRAALRASGYESEAAAVDQCLRTSIFQAIAVGWKLLYVHDLQYFMSFEEELLSFGCLSQTQDETLYQAARHMLEDYMDKNGDRVDEFLGGYDVGCSLAMTEPNGLLHMNGSSCAARPSLGGFDPTKKNGERRSQIHEQGSRISGQGSRISKQGSDKSQTYSSSSDTPDPHAPGENASGQHASGEKAPGENTPSDKAPGENAVSDPSSDPASVPVSAPASASPAPAASVPESVAQSGAPSVRPRSQDPKYPQSVEGGVTTDAHDQCAARSGGGGKKTGRGPNARNTENGSGNTVATGKTHRTLNADAFPPVGTLLTYRQDLRQSLKRFVADDKARLRQKNILHQMDETRHENHAGRTEDQDAVLRGN